MEDSSDDRLYTAVVVAVVVDIAVEEEDMSASVVASSSDLTHVAAVAVAGSIGFLLYVAAADTLALVAANIVAGFVVELGMMAGASALVLVGRTVDVDLGRRMSLAVLEGCVPSVDHQALLRKVWELKVLDCDP